MTPVETQIEARLLNEQRLSQEQFRAAYDLSQATSCSLAEALWRLNLMAPEAFLEIVAEVIERPTLKQWLAEPHQELDFRLAREFQPAELNRMGFFPCAQLEDGTVVIATEVWENPAAIATVQLQFLTLSTQIVLATRNQIQSLIVESSLETRLMTARMLTAAEWEAVRDTSQYTNLSIGQLLTGQGHISGMDYIQMVADLLDLPLLFRDEAIVLPEADMDLIQQFDQQALLTHLFLPYGWVDEQTLMVIVQRPLDMMVEALIYAKRPGVRLFKVLGTERDITALVDQLYQRQFSWRATYQLMTHFPEISASRVFTLSQMLGMYALVIAIFWGLLSNWWLTLAVLMALLNLFFIAAIGFKLVLSLVGALDELYRISDEEVAALDDRSLPLYTILIPVYNEPEVLPILVQALDQLDYPKDRLDVLLLLEENDTVTIESARSIHPPRYIRFIYVPESQPKTKPKALNYALPFARGEYLTIYDAEDIPEPDQLKKAIIAFRTSTPDLICVQAALNYFNYDENILTRMFTLEYSYWFDYIVPGLQTLRCPIPLGGTSNHFQLNRLRELGGWDPFNVTEDADLGIRASERGYRIGVINSTTFEEANCQLGNWIRQRSRWLKGYMQTWLVHTRYPVRSIRRLGVRKWAAAQLFMGGTILSFIATPILWIIFFYWLASRASWLDYLYPEWVLYISLFNLIFGNALGIYLNMIAVFRRRYYKLIFYSLLNPFYWLLHSVAGYIAIWQLYANTFYWEKTKHGLSKFFQHNESTSAE
ncbi:glycosyltransferase [Egbenema bharatensis]|uniref:glycosyltransferase n=1 Tax=Egbenema bharatensis TaxID=3463334 RepID=UPI003A883E9E